MSEISKERQQSLREGVEIAESYGFTVPVHPDELRALLDMADERVRYRAMLAGYAGALDELARVHDALGYSTEASDYRGKAHQIESALEGKTND